MRLVATPSKGPVGEAVERGRVGAHVGDPERLLFLAFAGDGEKALREVGAGDGVAALGEGSGQDPLATAEVEDAAGWHAQREEGAEGDAVDDRGVHVAEVAVDDLVVVADLDGAPGMAPEQDEAFVVQVGDHPADLGVVDSGGAGDVGDGRTAVDAGDDLPVASGDEPVMGPDRVEVRDHPPDVVEVPGRRRVRDTLGREVQRFDVGGGRGRVGTEERFIDLVVAALVHGWLPAVVVGVGPAVGGGVLEVATGKWRRLERGPAVPVGAERVVHGRAEVLGERRHGVQRTCLLGGGVAHGLPRRRVAEQRAHSVSRVGPVDPDTVAGQHCFGQYPSGPVDDDVGEASPRRADDGRAARLRLRLGEPEVLAVVEAEIHDDVGGPVQRGQVVAERRTHEVDGVGDTQRPGPLVQQVRVAGLATRNSASHVSSGSPTNARWTSG